MEILKSASKIVFILFAVTICVAFIMGILQEQEFVKLAMMPLVFYFANKGDSATGVTTTTATGTTVTPPYLGK